MTQRFQFGDAFDCKSRDTFPFRPKTFQSYKIGRFEDQRVAESVVASEFHFDAGIGLGRKQYQLRFGIFSQETLLFGREFELKTFQIRVSLIGIEERCRPTPLRHEFFNAQNIGVIVVAGVERCRVENPVFENDKNLLVVVKFTEIFATSIVIES